MSKRPAERGGDSPFAVSAWPLRRKMSLALAVPLLLAGTLGGLRVHSDLVASSNSASSAQQVTALRPAVAYLTAAQEAAVASVGTDTTSRAALGSAIDDVRAAGQALEDAKESAELTPAQADQVDAVLDLTQAMRDSDAVKLSPGTWQAGLRQLQSGVSQLITTIVNAQITPEPKLDLLSQALNGRFSLALEQALAAGDRSGKTGSTELYSELGAEGAAIDRLASGLGTDQKTVTSLRSANAERFRTVRVGRANLGGPEAYRPYDRTIASLQDGIDRELSAAADDARTAALLNATVTVAALVAAVLLALLVSLLLLKPIRRVRDGALAVAREQLPDAVARIRAGEEPGEITPIDVSTHEEIGQLARAVDDLHRQAVVLASEEAELRSQVGQMFVTLSRRNTSLINQQLSQIERLERDEEDPKRLESLFALDHLAARMRRTSDSLLILADAPTASAVVEGLTVSDALQAATSGVQHYQRVHIGNADPVRLSGTAAADVIHLLTELVDNALAFSPPTSSVDVRTTTTARGVVVEVADAGLGMPADQLMKINHTLTSGGEVTPETARRMGLFVVCRLSQRHGVITTLRGNDSGGTTAVVLLPRAILPDLTASGISGPAEVSPRRLPAAPHPPEMVEPAPVPFERPLSLVPDAPVRTPELQPSAGAPTGPVAPLVPVAAVGSALPVGLPQRGSPVPAPVAAPVPVAAPELSVVPPVAVDEPVQPPVQAPLPSRTSAPLVGSNALDGDWTDPGEDDSESPIFRQLQSAWFTGDGAQPWRTTEIEAGWNQADAVAAAPTEASTSRSGLPMRRPGTRLVPGGVDLTPTVAVRDPEAIRARLSAHSSGVARGRRDAAEAAETS